MHGEVVMRQEYRGDSTGEEKLCWKSIEIHQAQKADSPLKTFGEYLLHARLPAGKPALGMTSSTWFAASGGVCQEPE